MIKVESFGVVPFRNVEGFSEVLLILHKEGNHWGFPKGKVNAGESGVEAAARELREETGLEVERFLLPEPLTEQYSFRAKRQMVVKTVRYFPALVKGELQLQVEEIRQAGWYTIPDALKQLTFKEARHILQEFLKILNLK